MHSCIARVVDVFVALVDLLTFWNPREILLVFQDLFISRYFKPIQGFKSFYSVFTPNEQRGCAVAEVFWEVLFFNNINIDCFRFAAATLLVSGPKPIRVTLGSRVKGRGAADESWQVAVVHSQMWPKPPKPQWIISNHQHSGFQSGHVWFRNPGMLDWIRTGRTKKTQYSASAWLSASNWNHQIETTTTNHHSHRQALMGQGFSSQFCCSRQAGGPIRLPAGSCQKCRDWSG